MPSLSNLIKPPDTKPEDSELPDRVPVAPVVIVGTALKSKEEAPLAVESPAPEPIAASEPEKELGLPPFFPAPLEEMPSVEDDSITGPQLPFEMFPEPGDEMDLPQAGVRWEKPPGPLDVKTLVTPWVAPSEEAPPPAEDLSPAPEPVQDEDNENSAVFSPQQDAFDGEATEPDPVKLPEPESASSSEGPFGEDTDIDPPLPLESMTPPCEELRGGAAEPEDYTIPEIPDDMKEGHEPAAAYIKIITEGNVKFLSLESGTKTLGRLPDSDIHLDLPYISGTQIEIKVKDDAILIRDKGSTNGTSIDGVKIAPEMDFEVDGSNMIQMGQARMKIRAAGNMETPVQGEVFVYRNPVDATMDDTIGLDNFQLDMQGRTRHDIMHEGKVVAAFEFNKKGQLILTRTKSKVPIKICVDGDDVDGGRYLNYGDRVQIGGNIYTPFPLSGKVSRTSKTPSQSLFLKYSKFQEDDSSFMRDLHVMEQAIRVLPEPFTGIALAQWNKMMDEELKKASDTGEACEIQKTMAAMDHLVGRAVCYAIKKLDEGGDPLEYFHTLEKNYRRKEFALIVKKFGQRAEGRLKNHRIKFNEKLDHPLKMAYKAKTPDDKIVAFLDNLPDEFFELLDRNEIRSGLFSGAYSQARTDAIISLNTVLNNEGILVWEDEGNVVLAKVHSVVEGNEGRSLVIENLRGFSSILGIYYAGMCHGTYGLIIMSREAYWLGDRTETHEHELQHLLDSVSGYMEEAEGKRDRNALVEATAIAAELIYSKRGNMNILFALWNRKVLSSKYIVVSGKYDRYSRASSILLDYTNERKKDRMSVRDALKQYIDDVYKDALGLTFTELYCGEDKSPAQIVAEHGALDDFEQSVTEFARTVLFDAG